MKRFFLITLVGLATAFPLAFAQNAKPYLGGGVGFTFIRGTSGGAFTFQGGADSLLSSLGFRGVGVIGVRPSFIEVAAEVIANSPSGTLKPYIGGGIGVSSGGAADAASRAISGFEVHGVGGLEFAASDSIGLFGEVQPRLYLANNAAFGLGFRFGANHHFE